MNDDFLHRIRVEPPERFMKSLKARLDRQLPPEPMAPRRSLFRVLAFGLLFGGSVFAISLLTVNGLPDFARQFAHTRHPDSNVDGRSTSSATRRAANGIPTMPANMGQHSADVRGSAGKAADSLPNTGASGPGSSIAPTATSVTGKGPTAPRPMINLMAPPTLREYMTSVAEVSGRSSGLDVSVTATDSDTETLAQLCGTGKSTANVVNLRIASVPRRITRDEYAVCTRNLGGIAEVSIGYQTIVLARSRLYGGPAVSARDLFLALAAEIPDPAHPQMLISNPNTNWDQVNAAFNNEPIEVFGPPAQSMTAIAFRNILFSTGCNSFPTMAALKQTDPAGYERVCTTLRKDGAYAEMPEEPFEAFETLQTHPNTVGVLAYGLYQYFAFYPQNKETVTTIPIGGVAPTRETITAGTYPGSRPLYLYVDQFHAYGRAPYFVASLLENVARGKISCVIPADPAQIQAIRSYGQNLPNLKL